MILDRGDQWFDVVVVKQVVDDAGGRCGQSFPAARHTQMVLGKTDAAGSACTMESRLTVPFAQQRDSRARK
jgi:hypothetical protein